VVAAIWEEGCTEVSAAACAASEECTEASRPGALAVSVEATVVLVFTGGADLAVEGLGSAMIPLLALVMGGQATAVTAIHPIVTVIRPTTTTATHPITTRMATTMAGAGNGYWLTFELMRRKTSYIVPPKTAKMLYL